MYFQNGILPGLIQLISMALPFEKSTTIICFQNEETWYREGK